MSDRRPSAKRYPGNGFSVRYSPARCLHAAECVQGLPEVFNPAEKPWIDAEQAPLDRIQKVVGRCPSGALWVEDPEGRRLEEVPDFPATVRVEENGPLICNGPLEARTPEGELISDDPRVAFCRCGMSKHPPFCDGTHSEAGFQDSGEIREVKIQPEKERSPDGVLRITVVEEGPLVLDGPLLVVGQDGARHGGGRCALCRCGASTDKPFCDGSHKDSGFGR